MVAVGNYMDVPVSSMEQTLTHFRGLPHRLEHVDTKKGIRFYDDAISTTPESTMAAISAIHDTETIFLGGSDRGYNFEKLAERISQSSIRNIVFFPDTGKRIKECLMSICTNF